MNGEALIAGRAAIVGIGETAYAKHGGLRGRTEIELCMEAISKAAEDAGVPLDEVDGFTSYGFERHEPVVIQAALGIPELRYANLVWGGGGGGCAAAVMNAVLAVATGQCRHAVAYRSICQGQYERYGQFRQRPLWGSFISPFGLMSPAQMTALTFRRHMFLYGTNREHLAEIALAFRDNAQRNPRAVTFGKPLDRDTYFAARPIADPFHLYDCCLETDGACAVLVTSTERARDLRQKPVRVLAAAQASGPGWSLGPMGTHNMPMDDYATINSKAVARIVFAQAGLTPADIDVAQIYDAFTGLIPMALEDYGFCGRGESGDFISSGKLRFPTGALPSNTAGGLLSEAYLHGLNLVLEGARQIRGTSTSQVKDAQTCLVTSGGGGGHKSALILGH